MLTKEEKQTIYQALNLNQQATVKSNPYTDGARLYYQKISDILPYMISAAIYDPLLAEYLMNMLQRHYLELNSFIDANYGRCKCCNKIYYEHSLCQKKDYKEKCEQEIKDDFPIFCVPEMPLTSPKSLNDIEAWRNYLNQLEYILKD